MSQELVNLRCKFSGQRTDSSPASTAPLPRNSFNTQYRLRTLSLFACCAMQHCAAARTGRTSPKRVWCHGCAFTGENRLGKTRCINAGGVQQVRGVLQCCNARIEGISSSFWHLFDQFRGLFVKRVRLSHRRSRLAPASRPGWLERHIR